MELKKIIENSDSVNIVSKISNKMSGNTFHHHYHILYDIRTLLGKEKKIYTEIGTYCGGSLSLMLQHDYETEINCIDPLHVVQNQEDIVSKNVEQFNIHNYKVNIHKKFSTDFHFISYLKSINFKTDILFIDGDHRFDAVISDFNIFKDFVNPGGYIIFDDYFDSVYSPEVKFAVDSIVTNIDKSEYSVIGTFPNIHKAHDLSNMSMLNEYILQKKNVNKYCIVMATYCRKNGKTPMYLKKSIESIINQLYTNWDLIIVGDKYEPENELLEIISDFKDKLVDNKIIYIKNNKVEREYIQDRWNLWCCAGANSTNIGVKYGRDNGYKYYCHLDDDDFWLSNHLSELDKVYSKYPNCIFANTQSTYKDKFLPMHNEVNEIYPNNRMPLSSRTIHSSFSFRMDIIPFYYFTHFEPIGISLASDANMLDNIYGFIRENPQYCSIYIPVLTCHHDFEAEQLIGF
jgi:cephalosporin hydroxylase